MKKILAIVLALTVVLVCFAACGNKTKTDATPTDAETTVAGEETTVATEEETTAADENNGGTDAPVALDAAGVLSAVFATYAEENKFPVGGGDMNNMVMDAAGKYDLSLIEELNVIAYLPASQNANVEEAANIMNMMNANSFTGAAYLLKDGADAATFAADFKAALDNAQWMCGFPEKFVVLQYGEYVITAYGLGVNIDYFKTQAASALAGSTVVLEGDIVA